MKGSERNKWKGKEVTKCFDEIKGEERIKGSERNGRKVRNEMFMNE